MPHPGRGLFLAAAVFILAAGINNNFSEAVQANEWSGITRPCRIRGKSAAFSKGFHIPTNLAVEKFPFSATVKVGTKCSGVTVAERHVITAAHCVTSYKGNKQEKDYGVKVGFLRHSGEFNWIPVKRIFVPRGWTKRKKPSVKDDYALLVLRQKHKHPFLSPAAVNSTVAMKAKSYVHFSAFDDKEQPNNLMHHVCEVEETLYGVMYKECSTNDATSGAGVYMQLYNLKEKDWERVLVAIQNSKPSNQVSGGQHSISLWITQGMMDTLCDWTLNSRFHLCLARRLSSH